MNLDSLRVHLENRDKTDKLTQFFVRKAIQEASSSDGDEPDYDQSFVNFLSNWMEMTSKHNVDVIYKHSGSPIELVFLNSLHLHLIKASSNLIPLFQESSSDHLKFMDSRINFCNQLFARYDEFFEKNPNGEFDHFIRLLKFNYEKTYGHSMPADELDEIHSLLLIDKNFLHDTFHFTLQPRLPTIQHNGRGMRPDLFIWCPAEPSLKIAVECDGFKWHGDSKSFTNDRQRDRILTRNNIQVIRFSGAEINREPQSVAIELGDMLETEAKRIKGSGRSFDILV